MAERTVIRAPNHLGDLVMALPALLAAPDADVQVARWLVPILEMVPGFAADSETTGRRILAMDRGRSGFLRAARTLRAGGYDRGILLTPSLSSALLFTAGRVRRRRGLLADARGPLLHEKVEPAIAEELHRSAFYHHLVTGETLESPPVPRLVVPESARERWTALVGPGEGPWVGIFPGSNAPSRRWDPDRFAAVARSLAGRGARVAVFGGPGERELAAEAAGEWALNLAGRTDLPTLAAGLAACSLLVTNDSGPMHLAAAVGTPTVSVQGASDPRETRPLGPGHAYLQRAELPCVPCVRNHCPRKGRGYVLPEAERECLRLIEVADVLGAVETKLAGTTTRG